MTDELERLYKSTYTAVVRFLYRKVFIRAMAHRPEKPRAWVFAVAANLARDEAQAAIRRRKCRQTRSWSRTNAEPPSIWPWPNRSDH